MFPIPKLEQIKALVESLEKEVTPYGKGVKASAKRARAAMLEIKDLAAQARRDILDDLKTF
jgi:hypothetical protein